MQRISLLLRLSGRLRPTTFIGASGLLLGIYGASYALTTASRTINLDSEIRVPVRTRKTVDTSDAQQQQQKSIKHFIKAQYNPDDTRLSDQEQSIECTEGTGIWRYDVVQIARYVFAFCTYTLE